MLSSGRQFDGTTCRYLYCTNSFRWEQGQEKDTTHDEIQGENGMPEKSHHHRADPLSDREILSRWSGRWSPWKRCWQAQRYRQADPNRVLSSSLTLFRLRLGDKLPWLSSFSRCVSGILRYDFSISDSLIFLSLRGKRLSLNNRPR